MVDCRKHTIFIDDLSEREAINLKKQLTADPVKRPYPLNYHEQTEQIVPQNKSLLLKNLSGIEICTKNNQMKINSKIFKAMFFNKSRKYDFPPYMQFQDGNILECIDETKLLGIYLSSSLSWEAICKKKSG